MDPILVGAVAAPVVGGLVGGIMGGKSRKQQMAMMQQAYNELNKLGLPPDLSKEIIMREFESQGVLTPQLESDINLAASEVAKIQEDPSLKAAQMEALSTLGQVSRQGLRAEDRAALNEVRNQIARDTEARRQQVLQQMQARGMGGSGGELLAQLQGSQAAEDQASAQADRLAAQASQNALSALAQRAQLAGSVRSQDLTADEMRARALDERNRMLWQNSQALQQRNIAALNAAQQANLANKQRLAEMNVSQANQELQRQNEAKRDYWQDQLGLARAKASALTGQAQAYGQEAQRKQDMFSGIGSAVGQGFGAYGAYQAKQPATKQDPVDTKYLNDPRYKDIY